MNDCSLTCLLIIVPVVLIIAIVAGLIGLGVAGVNYWIEISGPAYDNPQELDLEPYASATVFFPETIRPREKAGLEIEFSPSALITDTFKMEVTVIEESDFIGVEPSVLTKTVSSPSGRFTLVPTIESRNLRLPPRQVQLTVDVSIDGGQVQDQAISELTVDAWTGKLTAVVSILLGAVGVIATLLGVVSGFIALVTG